MILEIYHFCINSDLNFRSVAPAGVQLLKSNLLHDFHDPHLAPLGQSWLRSVVGVPLLAPSWLLVGPPLVLILGLS